MSTLRLPEQLTLDRVRPALAAFEAELRGAASGPLSVDVGALQRFDSGALAVLLELRRRAAAAGRTFECVGSSPRLQSLAQLYGVDSLLFPTASAAPAAA